MPNKLLRSDILELDSTAQLIALPNQSILTRHAGGLTLLRGIKWEVIEEIKLAVDGVRDAETIHRNLQQRLGSEFTINTLQQLLGGMLRLKHPPDSRLIADDANVAFASPTAPSFAESKIEVLANGSLGKVIADILTTECSNQVGISLAGEALTALTGATDLVLVVMENTAYKTLFDLQQSLLSKGQASLFITLDPDGIRIGPAVLPGLTPCLACAQLAGYPFQHFPAEESLRSAGSFHTLAMSEMHPNAISKMLRILHSEIAAFLNSAATLSTLSAFHLVSPNGPHRLLPFSKAVDCPLCSLDATFAANNQTKVNKDAHQVRHRMIRLVEQRPGSPNAAPPQRKPMRIGVLGGGTAGYLTALALWKKVPNLDITLIESSALGVIGVGEATTPLMPQFLHVDLGLDIHEFFQKVKPTFKLGIRFEWGSTKQDYFQYPFGHNLNLEAYQSEGNIRNNSLWSLLMTADKVPISVDESNSLFSYFDANVAYHLDNQRFVAYLEEKFASTGMKHIDATIQGASLTADQQNIESIVAKDGRSFHFDLYIDCSGFSSLLLEKNLKSEFLSYEKSLFADSAIIANVPHGGIVKPYTTAEAMSAGWCWNTPQWEQNHRGYVFCSAFQKTEDAAEEMRLKNPGMENWKLIKFPSGRHRHFWKGNVVAMGNAYGFVEPLESTALHLLIRQIGLLLSAFPIQSQENGLKAILNRKVGDYWDYVSWFLALHYKFNQKQNTPFWQACRSKTDVSSYGELIELFQERGPLAYQAPTSFAFDYPDPLWGAEGIDTILLGQQLPTHLPQPNHHALRWQHCLQMSKPLVQQSLSQANAYDQFKNQPELLTKVLRAFKSVGPAFSLRRRV